MSLTPFSAFNPIPKSTSRRIITLVLITFAGFLLVTDLSAIFSKFTDMESIIPHRTSQSLNQYASDKPPSSSSIDGHDLTLLREMVTGTKGYFARDYSLGLGWNNVRYIVEAALIQARILNRTAILPSFVYARACEYNITVCADYAVMVDRGKAVGSDEWKDLPVEQQVAWRIPITMMLNITHVRRYQPVLLVSEYLQLHNLPVDIEKSDGSWDRSAYHTSPSIPTDDPEQKNDLFVIENDWFDPTGTNRVDIIHTDMKERGRWTPNHDLSETGAGGYWDNVQKTAGYLKLEAALAEDRHVLEWHEARTALRAELSQLVDPNSDEALKQLIQDNGWEVLHTFDCVLSMEYSKSVVDPILQVVPRESIRGFRDDYDQVTESVVLLAGETHLYRKPGTVRFTSVEARDEFARIVLRAVHPPDSVLDLADRISQRMTERSQGHLWMGAHMRRGDFVRVGWAMESELESHFNRIKQRLDAGRQVLDSITEHNVKAYNIPDGKPDHSLLAHALPPRDYQFYLATDERNPKNLEYMRKNGAILVYDLLTVEDRQKFGWSLMLTDVLALVEQAILMHAAYFYGHAMSSVSGGIINMRAARGADPRTSLID